MSKKLYIGNLSYETSEDDLRELFGQAGTVESIRLITDSYSGRSKGFGFVEMSSDAEAENAISTLNGSSLADRTIVVDEARPQRDKNRGRGGGGGGYGGGRGGGRGGGYGGGRGGRDRSY